MNLTIKTIYRATLARHTDVRLWLYTLKSAEDVSIFRGVFDLGLVDKLINHLVQEK